MRKKTNVTRLEPRRLRGVEPPAPKTETTLEDILVNLQLPQDILPIPLEVKKAFARYPAELREQRFAEYAEAEFHSRTNNIENMLRERLPDLQNKYAEMEAEHRKLSKRAEDVDAVEVSQHHQPKGASMAGSMKRLFQDKELFSYMKPVHKLQLSLLGSTALAVSTIGAASIFQYLQENSDVYATQWWLCIPLMIIPFGGGVGLEQLIQKIKREEHRRRAELIVGVVAILSFIVWLIGLLDMADTGGGMLQENAFELPEGLRVVSQVVFEVTVIALITSSAFKIISGYWPDTFTPSAEKEARNKARDDFEAAKLAPMSALIDKTKLWIKPYEGARVKFVQRECAEFAAVCADYDAYKLDLAKNSSF